MDNPKITIKKGENILFQASRSELVSCNETSDGIVFQFKDGFLLYYTDPAMHNGNKMKIKLTIDKMINGDIIVDLNNQRNIISFIKE